MTELLTAAQMRAIEQAAIDSGEVTGLELMERAGRGVVEAILEWRPELAKTSHRAVVLCGPGNNGGDGFVVARLLKQRGWEVEVFLYGADPDDLAKLPPDAAENARRWREFGKIKEPFGPKGARFDVIVDAVLGAGLSRKVDDIWLGDFEDFYHHSDALYLSIDAPTGVCMDSGKILTTSAQFLEYFPAHLTVTFHQPRVGHYLADGPICCGDVKTVPIMPLGWDRDRQNKRLKSNPGTTPNLTMLRRAALRPYPNIESIKLVGTAPSPGWSIDKQSSHKYGHGHALILSGGPGKGGAARLAARGALRIGAGLVTVGSPPEALTENAARLDAVMLAEVKGVDGLQAELRDRKINAVCIGPGFGLGQRLRDFVEAALMGWVEPHPTVVLDADALTEYRDDPETLFVMLNNRCVLTPHEGEFGRLFPDILAKLKEPATKGPAYSKVDATREAAKRAGCVVLFKGPDTVIADPDGRCAINSAHYDRAAPWLATAGSGDVLAGFITGLLARGFNPMTAAETAAWLHVECALKFGPGLIAEDLPEQLPAVFRDLGL